MTVGHNSSVSGVAAFGSQDLGFRTSTFGSQDLGFRTSGVAAFGSQDLGFRTSINEHCSLLLLLSSCFYNASVAAFGSQDLGFRTSLACVSPPPWPAAPKCNRGRFCHRKCRDRFCHRIVVSDRNVDSAAKCPIKRTHGRSEFIYKMWSPIMVVRITHAVWCYMLHYC